MIERKIEVVSPTIVIRPLHMVVDRDFGPSPDAVPGETRRFCQAFTGVVVERFKVNVVKLLRVYGG